MLMALLKHDVPFFRQRFVDAGQDATDLLKTACDAYLEGYQERAHRTLNPKRLLCLDPISFDRVIRLLHDLSEKFPADGADSS